MPHQVPLLVVEPGATPIRQYVRDVFHHRDLMRVLGYRELKLRYRQTALGVTWVVLQPLLSAGILGFVFNRVARLPTDGVPSFAFTFAGFLAWTIFSSTVLRSTTSIVANSSLVSKIFFPRVMLPLSTLVAVVVDFLVGFAVMVPLLASNHLLPGARLLTLPLWLLLLIMFSQGLGSILATFSVRYRDIPQIAPVLLQLLLYASPVAYSVSAVPARYRSLYEANPLASLLGAFRWSVVGTPFPSSGPFVEAVVCSVVFLVAGWFVLEKKEAAFADVI